MDHFIMPSTEGWDVEARDLSKPKGKTFLESKLFRASDKAKAEAYRDSLQQKYPHAQVKMYQCVF